MSPPDRALSDPSELRRPPGGGGEALCSPRERLSSRQREVLDLLVRGLTNGEIATVLGVAPSTVKTHVGAICRAFEADNRTEVAGMVSRLGRAEAADDTGSESPSLEAFAARPAIAVLPFEARGWAEGEVFGLGLADDLSTLLTRWRWFPVIARSSTFKVSVPLAGPLLGRELRARYLLHGSLRRSGEQLRVSAFLDDVERGVCLWSDRFDLAWADTFDRQDALAEAIVGAAYPLAIQTEVQHTAFTRTPALDAWTRTHQALGSLDRRSREDNREALRLLDEALALDPTFLPALFGRGQALFNEVINAWSPDEAPRRALHLCAERAVHLRPDVALGHFLRARAAMAHGDMSASAEHARTATALNPSFASAHALLGRVWITEGRESDGLERLGHAARLSPRAYVAGLAISRFAVGDLQGALSAARHVLAERPGYVFARLVACASLILIGEEAEARAEARALDPGFRLSSLRRLYTRFETGDRVLDAARQAGVPE